MFPNHLLYVESLAGTYTQWINVFLSMTVETRGRKPTYIEVPRGIDNLSKPLHTLELMYNIRVSASYHKMLVQGLRQPYHNSKILRRSLKTFTKYSGISWTYAKTVVFKTET